MTLDKNLEKVINCNKVREDMHVRWALEFQYLINPNLDVIILLQDYYEKKNINLYPLIRGLEKVL